MTDYDKELPQGPETGLQEITPTTGDDHHEEEVLGSIEDLFKFLDDMDAEDHHDPDHTIN